MSASGSGKWQFFIDRGGSFTDVIAKSPDGQLHIQKLLSQNPEHYEDAALEGIRRFLEIKSSAPIPGHKISRIRMGTTVATNALLERKGAPVALAITKGLKDTLEIGYQTRDDIFALNVEKPDPFYESLIEVPERISATGKVIEPLDIGEVKDALKSALDQGVSSLAICLLNAYQNPVHEQRLANLAKKMGFRYIITSAEASAHIKMVSRGQTAVLDAYLSPILSTYVNRVVQQINPSSNENGPEISFMQSSGGLAKKTHFHGRNAILSGPAGGVVGAVKTARSAGFDKIIGFDMGGTSTDVCHYAGQYERANETKIAGQYLRTPMLEIHTVAAGGGSILSFDGHRFCVGPQSAGANPGPACYGRAGPATVSDLNVILGKLNPELFPKIFGPDQSQPLDAKAAKKRLLEIIGQTAQPLEEIAEGFLNIAIDHMARAIKKISMQRGHDLAPYTLVCFGGAGAQHACGVAEVLGIKSILIHPFAGLLSAYGISLAEHMVRKSKYVNRPISEFDKIKPITNVLRDEGLAELAAQGVHTETLNEKIFAHMRTDGSDTVLDIAIDKNSDLETVFARAHKARFSFFDSDARIIIESISVEISAIENETGKADFTNEIKPKRRNVRFFSKGSWREAHVFARHEMQNGKIYKGPLVVIDDGGTNIIEPDWQARLLSDGQLHLTQQNPSRTRVQHATNCNPVRLELMNNLFMSIAEQMGAVLQKTASSVNIKERLDFSCAVFDKDGGLVANAPHMPVHIGSMDASLNALIKSGLAMKPGDSFIHNNPYDGGTHLPDINVITPVFVDGDLDPAYFVISRGHHADIGGLTPGSMSPLAMSIEEEGVLINCRHLVKDGKFCNDDVYEILTTAAFPARNPERNISDLKAQIAANTNGARALVELYKSHGREMVDAYMAHAQDYGEHCVRRAIGKLAPGHHVYEMDQGSKICVKIDIDPSNKSAKIDFTGTSPQRNDNFNAPAAVTKAAVLYVFRCLVGENIPLNSGCLRPLEISIPDGSLLNPTYPAAIVAGNVELSQMITNALFSALGVLGTSQGTMNNLTFGNGHYQYYETICSGAPAGPGFHGASAIQTHMTNSRLTDPEILESRYPVRLKRFEIMRRSGGHGKWHAGDGVRRAIEFLQPMSVAILSGNRKIPCGGIAGGHVGQLGKNTIIRKSGKIEHIDGCANVEIGSGDIFMVETPTGGGYGRADDE